MRNYNTKYEILSAYLDGELSHREVRELEEKIRHSVEMQEKLAELKKIKQLTKSAPIHLKGLFLNPLSSVNF